MEKSNFLKGFDVIIVVDAGISTIDETDKMSDSIFISKVNESDPAFLLANTSNGYLGDIARNYSDKFMIMPCFTTVTLVSLPWATISAPVILTKIKELYEKYYVNSEQWIHNSFALFKLFHKDDVQVSLVIHNPINTNKEVQPTYKQVLSFISELGQIVPAIIYSSQNFTGYEIRQIYNDFDTNQSAKFISCYMAKVCLKEQGNAIFRVFTDSARCIKPSQCLLQIDTYAGGVNEPVSLAPVHIVWLQEFYQNVYRDY